YAARAGTRMAYAWGDQIGKGNANCKGCGSQWDDKQTAPVGSFTPNAFGLYDMGGNVSEWVEDFSHDNYDGAPTDGGSALTDACSLRVIRDGSWGNLPRRLRSAVRIGLNTDGRYYDLGFRVARTLAL